MYRPDDIRAATLAIAVPARNEAARISACLAALATQTGPDGRAPAVFVIANDCTDDTVRVTRDGFRRFGLAGSVIACGVGSAGVGRARALGCEAAVQACPGLQTVLTTDADCTAAPEWAAAMARALTRGAAAAGRILPAPDPFEPRARGPRRSRTEHRYIALTRRFHELVGHRRPGEAHDTGVGGANLGFRIAELMALGGIPQIPSQEDRTIAAIFRAAGHRVVAVPEAVVHASCRRDGRAPGGMAEAIRNRSTRADPPLDSALRPLNEMLEEIALGRGPGPTRLTLSAAGRDLPRLEACVRDLAHLTDPAARLAHVRRMAFGARSAEAGLVASAAPVAHHRFAQ